jgi:hypothetical protein
VSGGLARAFRETDYLAGGAVARIGRREPSVAALLRLVGAREGAFVTAWNPLALPQSLGWNRRAQARLRQAVRCRVAVPARSQPRPEAQAHWGEDQLFLAGDLRPTLRLARRFRQLAIVAVRADGRARLVWLPKPQEQQVGG